MGAKRSTRVIGWFACALWVVAWGPVALAGQKRSQPVLDSVVVERVPGWFETGGTYRVVVSRSDGVRFYEGPAGGVTVDVDSATVAHLLAAAKSLELESLPGRLMGQRPYCAVVRTDHPGARITIMSEERRHSVTDDHGCPEGGDRSQSRVLHRLRVFERDVYDRLRLGELFDARPLVN